MSAIAAHNITLPASVPAFRCPACGRSSLLVWGGSALTADFAVQAPDEDGWLQCTATCDVRYRWEPAK